MKQTNYPESNLELTVLCDTVRELVSQKKYQECILLIQNAMRKYPHAAEPHNLIGILLEKEDDHISAMKHFRAAWALDPTYIPARCNLERYGNFYAVGQCAFDETDCIQEQKDNPLKVEYDEHGIGRVVRRIKL